MGEMGVEVEVDGGPGRGEMRHTQPDTGWLELALRQWLKEEGSQVAQGNGNVTGELAADGRDATHNPTLTLDGAWRLTECQAPQRGGQQTDDEAARAPGLCAAMKKSPMAWMRLGHSSSNSA